MGVKTMKIRLWMLNLAIAGVCCLFMAAPGLASTSIVVDEPGFYGRLDLGGYPSPRLLYPDAIIINRVASPPPPAYLRVPPGHAKKWAKHCHRYNACGQPVFFVNDDWYQNVYVPRYREIHGTPGPMRMQPRPVVGELREVKVKEERRAIQTNHPGPAKVKQARSKENNGKANKANKGNKGNGKPGKGNSGNGKGPNK